MMLALSDFRGEWRVTRGIEDRLAARPGRFEGLARFEEDGTGLRYREEGMLRLGDGPAFSAHRDYLWRPGPAGAVMVLFPDGRPFHSFLPEGMTRGTDHPCGRDLYRVAYDLEAWPAWTVEWTVTGPAKDYRMTTAYARA